MTIKLKQIERTCRYNDEIHAKGTKRGLIYDFEVHIDGEYRAVWQASGGKDGYWLTTAKPGAYKITRGDNFANAARCPSRQIMLKCTTELLPRIPTLEEIAAKREADRAHAEDVRKRELARDRLDRIKKQAERMYQILMALADYVDLELGAGVALADFKLIRKEIETPDSDND